MFTNFTFYRHSNTNSYYISAFVQSTNTKKDYIHVAFFADTECLGADKSSLMQIRFIRLSLNSFGFCLNLSKKSLTKLL